MTTVQYSPFAAGTGRLDAAAAVRSTLYASGSAFAAVKWPYPASGLVQKDVTYTNNGSEPVTLNLSLKNQGIPAGLFTLTTPQIMVPAHGTATAGVVSHLEMAADDAGYSSMLTATDADGAVRAHTSIGVSKQSQRVKLSLRAQDQHGAPLSGVVVLKDIKRDAGWTVGIRWGALSSASRRSTSPRTPRSRSTQPVSIRSPRSRRCLLRTAPSGWISTAAMAICIALSTRISSSGGSTTRCGPPRVAR